MFFLSLLKELATDIQSLEQFDSIRCPKKFKSKFIHYIIIKNYYYSLVDACCYYEMINFLVGAKSTFYSSSECYVEHC